MTASFHVAATGTVTASSTTNTITLPGTLSTGDLMIIAASANYAVTSVATPSTTFTKLASAQASGDTTATAEVWYAYAASGDAGAVCTVTCGTASYPSTAFASYQNAAVSSPIDSSATDHTTGGSDVTAIPCTGATTASVNVLPVSVIGGGGASASPTLTAPSGYTIRSQGGSGDYEAVAIADAAAVSSSGTGYGSGSWTYGGGGGGATVTFGIKAAASGPVSSSGSAAVAALGASGTNEAPTGSGGAGVGAAGTSGTASGGGGATNPSWDASGTNAVGGAGYTSTFSDDFTGTSLNTSNWTAGWQVTSGVTPPINVPSSTGNVGVDGESAAYSSAQISVADSILTLAITETSTTVDSITYPYLGSCVTTNPSTLGSGNGFQQALGCFEARIKMTASGGFLANWPAWWLDGQTWPADGELDILEGLGGDAAFHVNSTDNEPAVGSSAPGESLSASQFADGNWHTFGLSWNETQCDFYYDGALVGSVATHVPIAQEYLVFDLTTGWQSGPEAAGTMQIDWVRVWEQPTTAVTLTPMAGLTNSFASSAALFQDFSGLGVAASGGQATVLCDDTYENALQSITQYNLTGSSLWAKMAIPSGSYEVGFQLSDLAQEQNIDTGDSAGLIASADWSYDGTNLVASLTQNQTTTTVATLTYSATTHAYWKISESGGTLTWWTSTDGSAWTSRGTHTYTISVAALYVNIWGGSDSGSTANLVVSDLNGGPPSTVTSTGAAQSGSLRTTGTVSESGGTVTTSGSAGLASTRTGGTGGPVVAVTSTGAAGLAAAGVSGGVSPLRQEVFANTPSGTVTSGGTGAPAAGTAESWTVDVTAAFAGASASGTPVTFWYGADADLPGEIFLCTGCPGGTGSQSLSVIRGADGTTPAAHAGGFRLVQVVSRASLEALQNLTGAVNVVTQFGADPTGVADSTTAITNAVTAAQAAGQGVVYLPRGTYLVSSTITVSQSGIYLVGDGLWATFLNFTGTGDCLRWYDASTYTSRAVHGGGPLGISVNIGSAGSGSAALHAGDILRFQFAITVEGSGSTSSTGVHLDNQNYWCEQAVGTAYIDSCTQAVVFDCSGATTSTGSYDRGDFTFYLSQKTFLGSCVVFQNGAQILGGRLRLYGNINSSNTTFTQSVLQLTGATPGGHTPATYSGLVSCDIQINLESDEANTYTFQTINFGSTNNTIFDCSGSISFGAGNQFTVSNVTSTTTQFVFQGPIVGDSNLAAQCIINRLAIFSTVSFFGIPTFQAPLLIDEHAAPSTPTGGGYVYVDTTGNLHFLGPGGGDTEIARSASAPAASVSYTPTDPTGAASTSLTMMGMGSTMVFTPKTTGKVLAIVTAAVRCAGTADPVYSVGRYGTGTAPANAAAASGTKFGVGNDTDYFTTSTSASESTPVTFQQVLTLTAGTAYWFDVALAAPTAGTATAVNITATFVELPS